MRIREAKKVATKKGGDVTRFENEVWVYQVKGDQEPSLVIKRNAGGWLELTSLVPSGRCLECRLEDGEMQKHLDALVEWY